MSKVLLTGSNGFLGKNIKKRLEKDGYEVICYDRKLDVAKYFYPKDIDYVINCAGEIRNTDNMFYTNLLFLYNLLFLAKINGVKKFIHFGSSSELGNTNATRFEKSPANPQNWYEGTKAAATMICQGFSNEFDFDVVIARPFTIYGKYMQENRFLPTLWDAFVNDKPVHLYPGYHDYVYIDDFVEGILLLLNANKLATQGQIYNLSSGYTTSNKEIVTFFEKCIGKNLNIIKHDEKYHDYDCDNWVGDNTKAYIELGWKPRINLYQGIKKYVDWKWFEQNAVDVGGL